MTNYEITSIILIVVFCGLLLMLYVFLNENVKDLKMLMGKQTSLFRELIHFLTDDEEEETPAPEDEQPLSKPQQEYYNIAIDEAIITDEEWKIKNPYAQVSSRMNYLTWMTIKECIELLSTDGKGTKQQVKERLEELIKDE